MADDQPELDEEELETILAYHRVAATKDGQIIIKDIMDILGLHSTIENTTQAALHNAAVAIMRRAGIFREWNDDILIKVLFSLPYSPSKALDKEIAR